MTMLPRHGEVLQQPRLQSGLAADDRGESDPRPHRHAVGRPGIGYPNLFAQGPSIFLLLRNSQPLRSSLLHVCCSTDIYHLSIFYSFSDLLRATGLRLFLARTNCSR